MYLDNFCYLKMCYAVACTKRQMSKVWVLYINGKVMEIITILIVIRRRRRWSHCIRSISGKITRHISPLLSSDNWSYGANVCLDSVLINDVQQSCGPECSHKDGGVDSSLYVRPGKLQRLLSRSFSVASRAIRPTHRRIIKMLHCCGIHALPTFAWAAPGTI